MVTSVGRWLLDEASSGTGPSTAFDDENSNDLTIDYSSGDANWTSIASGNGLDYTATVATSSTAIMTLSNISANGNIGSSFGSGTQQLSFIIVFDIDAGDASAPRLVQIGTDGGDGDFAIGTRGSDWLFRWSKESGGSDVTYPVPGGGYGTGLMVMAVAIDSTEATAADRIKVWYNNVLQTANSGTIALNESVDLDNTAYNFSLGNRETLNRNIDGQLFYAELFTGVLTTQEVSDSHTALIANNDANWDGGTIISATTDTLVLTEQNANVNAENNVAATTDNLVLTENNASVNASTNVNATTDTLAITEFNPTILKDVNIDATTDSLTLTEFNATISTGTNISATTDSLVITEQNADVKADTNVNSGFDSLVITEFNATVSTGVEIEATTDTLVLTEFNADIGKSEDIQANTDNLVITTYQATVEVVTPDYFIDGVSNKLITTDYGTIKIYGNNDNWFTL